eukprot:9432462-Pyramimonas_sp.AAC.1
MAPKTQTPLDSYRNKKWHQQQYQHRPQQCQGDTTGTLRTQWRARSRDDTHGTGSSSSPMGQQHQ